MVPILSQMHPFHTFPPFFPKIHSNIILPPTSSSSELSLPFRFFNQYTTSIYPLPCMLHVPPTSSSLIRSPFTSYYRLYLKTINVFHFNFSFSMLWRTKSKFPLILLTLSYKVFYKVVVKTIQSLKQFGRRSHICFKNNVFTFKTLPAPFFKRNSLTLFASFLHVMSLVPSKILVRFSFLVPMSWRVWVLLQND